MRFSGIIDELKFVLAEKKIFLFHFFPVHLPSTLTHTICIEIRNIYKSTRASTVRKIHFNLFTLEANISLYTHRRMMENIGKTSFMPLICWNREKKMCFHYQWFCIQYTRILYSSEQWLLLYIDIQHTHRQYMKNTSLTNLLTTVMDDCSARCVGVNEKDKHFDNNTKVIYNNDIAIESKDIGKNAQYSECHNDFHRLFSAFFIFSTSFFLFFSRFPLWEHNTACRYTISNIE